MVNARNQVRTPEVRRDPMREAQTGDPRRSPAQALNAVKSVRESAGVQTATPAREGREAARLASATPPSKCELCVPKVRIVEDSYFLTVSEAIHQVGCLNHPRKDTQLLKESTTW